jgi:hypothetical protein
MVTADPPAVRSGRLLWLALAAMMGAFCPIGTSAEELVTFNSAPYRLGHIQERLAQERGETPKAPESIEGYLSKPDGDGPFPAIVYLHGCSGLSADARKRVAHLLTGWGYVSLAVDSFSTRGIKEACTRLPDRQGDALARYPISPSFASLTPNGSRWLDHRRAASWRYSWARRGRSFKRGSLTSRKI